MTKQIPIQLFAYTGMSLLDFSGPLDVFQTANHLSSDETEPYDISVVSMDGEVELSLGMSLRTLPVERTLSVPNTLIIPGGPAIPHDVDAFEFRSAFSSHARKASRVATVCSGAFVLAATGQLDGRRATTLVTL